jgi:hypothetical protein
MDAFRSAFQYVSITTIIAGVILAIYMTAYFLMGTHGIRGANDDVRIFNHEWQAQLFKPAAEIDSCFRHQTTSVAKDGT